MTIAKFIIAIGLPLLVGYTSSFFTMPAVEGWYTTIKKPSWNPPDAVFGPVWTLLYIMMGVALFLVWLRPATLQRTIASIWFAVQLVLNFFWSFIFFDQHQIGWALVEIVLLWLAILCTIFAFARVSKPAAWLLVPYISWVSFATILNYSIFKLNS